jgi:hypothetical protein
MIILQDEIERKRNFPKMTKFRLHTISGMAIGISISQKTYSGKSKENGFIKKMYGGDFGDGK